MAQLTDLEKVRRRRARRRMVRSLFILALFAAVVFLCVTVIRQAGDLDLKTAYSDLRAGMASGDGYPVSLPGGQVTELESAGDALVMLTDTNLYTYNSSGGQMLGVQHGMASQTLKTARDRILLYDPSAEKLAVYSKSAQLSSVTTDSQIHTADLATNGNFAVVTGANDALARVIVYNRGAEEIFRFSGNTPIISISLADNRDTMAVGFVDASDGKYLSSIRKFQFSYQEGDTGRVDLPGELLLMVDYRSASAIRALTDQRVILFDGDLRETASFAFGETVLDRYADSPDGRLVLVLGNYDKEKRLSVVTLDRDFNEIGRFTIDYNISGVKADSDYIYLMAKDRLHILGFDGAMAASVQINSLSQIQPVGGKLYYTTDTAINVIDIGEIAPPASSGKEAPASSGEESAPEDEDDGPSGEASLQPSGEEAPSESGGDAENLQPDSAPESASEPESAPESAAPSGDASSGDLLNYDDLAPGG